MTSAIQTPRIFVIVVTYNGKLWLNKCLGTLRHPDIRLDVVIVDNGSTDGTPDVIRERWPEVTLIETGQNLGFGKANNIGIRYALDKGFDYVYLLNQDAWIEPEAILRLTELHRRNPRYGVLSPMQMQADNVTPDANFARCCEAPNCTGYLADMAADRSAHDSRAISTPSVAAQTNDSSPASQTDRTNDSSTGNMGNTPVPVQQETIIPASDNCAVSDKRTGNIIGGTHPDRSDCEANMTSAPSATSNNYPNCPTNATTATLRPTTGTAGTNHPAGPTGPRHTLRSVYDIRHVMAAHWLISAEAVSKVGGFAPIFSHYGEDYNYLDRLYYHGMKAGICPHVCAVHDRAIRPPWSKDLNKAVFMAYNSVFLPAACDISVSATRAIARALWTVAILSCKYAAKHGSMKPLRLPFMAIAAIGKIMTTRRETKIQGALYL